jgi:hypothetical protein
MSRHFVLAIFLAGLTAATAARAGSDGVPIKPIHTFASQGAATPRRSDDFFPHNNLMPVTSFSAIQLPTSGGHGVSSPACAFCAGHDGGVGQQPG